MYITAQEFTPNMFVPLCVQNPTRVYWRLISSFLPTSSNI